MHPLVIQARPSTAHSRIQARKSGSAEILYLRALKKPDSPLKTPRMIKAALAPGGANLGAQVVALHGVPAEDARVVEARIARCAGAEEEASFLGQDASLWASWARPVDEPVGAQKFRGCAVAHCDGNDSGALSLRAYSFVMGFWA